MILKVILARALFRAHASYQVFQPSGVKIPENSLVDSASDCASQALAA
ncbi:MAG: hypothetical protein LBW85_10485 [Deltaproteobacteria bacterium]|nr:hypothetical protein [Deltaproteobacteria bacterium]